MQFRNVDPLGRDLDVAGLGHIGLGTLVALTADEVPGIVGQCGPDGSWEPADQEATDAYEEFLASLKDPEPKPEAVDNAPEAPVDEPNTEGV